MMQWLTEQLGAIGGGAGVLAFLGSCVTGLIAWRREWTKKRAAEVKRDVALAPKLLERNEALEKQRDDITGRFETATRDLDGCERARKACERTAAELRAELGTERERSAHERQILHDAIGDLASTIDELRTAVDRAPGPYRATGESMAERMQRTLSQSTMPAYRSTPPDGVPRTEPEMPSMKDDKWDE